MSTKTTQRRALQYVLILTLISRIHSREDGSLSIVICDLYVCYTNNGDSELTIFNDRNHSFALSTHLCMPFVIIVHRGYGDIFFVSTVIRVDHRSAAVRTVTDGDSSLCVFQWRLLFNCLSSKVCASRKPLRPESAAHPGRCLCTALGLHCRSGENNAHVFCCIQALSDCSRPDPTQR